MQNGGAGEGRGGAARRRLPRPAASRGGDCRVRFGFGSAVDSRGVSIEISILLIRRPPDLALKCTLLFDDLIHLSGIYGRF